MPSLAETSPETTSRSSPQQPAPRLQTSKHNFWVLAVYQMVVRTGWIFKTESIIMPAVLDLLGGGAWLRGCLPVLNRFGLSIPPIAFSRHVQTMPRKKRMLASTSLYMGGCFLLLALAWQHREAAGRWMPLIFLSLYTFFFMCTGVNQLTLGTLNGKLVRPHRRGALMLAANTVGAAVAIGCALLLLRRWLATPDGYVWIFGFAGSCFALTAGLALLLREPADNYQQPRASLPQLLARSWRTLRADANLRRLAWISGLFGCSFMLFPHYQALAIRQLGLEHQDMLSWVVLQNAGTAVFSMLVGPLADARGNRSVLRLTLLGIILAPLLAIWLSTRSNGAVWFPIVFLLVGLTPITLRIFQNYALEISAPKDHALYLSTLSLVVGVSVFASPLVGLLLDLAGFGPVFLATAGVLFLAWLLTWRLAEPRHAINTPAD